ncbi:MAG: DUF4870 domain-containing protein [Planctomycetota bacterium]
MSEDHEQIPAEPQPTPENADPTPPAIDPASLTTDDTNMGMLAHLLGIVGFLGPLIIWLIQKDKSAFADQEGKEALNFQIFIFIIYIVLVPVTALTCGVGGFLYLPVFVCAIVFSIMGAMKAKDGIGYRYPLTLRLIK